MRRRRQVLFAALLLVVVSITWIARLEREISSAPSSTTPARTSVDADAQSRDTVVLSPETAAERSLALDRDDRCELIVRTRNAWNHALPGIDVYIASHGARARVGATDERGEIRAPVARGEFVRIEASAGGFATAAVELESPCDRTAELVLAGESRLVGRVMRADGSPVTDAQVFAWPSESRPNADDIYARRAVESRLHVVDTSSEGRFEIGGLDPRVPYTLAAGANGLAPRDWILDARPGDTDHTIDMWHVYGSSVRLVSAEGGPLETSPRFTNTIGLVLQGDLAKRVLPRSLDFQFAGLAPKTTDESASFGSFLGVKAAASTSEYGPVSISISLPGYEPMESKVRLPRIDVSLSEQVFALRPTVAGFGSLAFDLIGATDLATSSDVEDAWAWIVLANETEKLRIPLRSLVDHQVVDGIPFGHFHAHLEVGRLYRAPAEGRSISLEIGADTARAVFDLSDAGAVEIELDTPSGVETGPLTVYVVSAARGMRQPFTFTAPPYRIRAVAPGRYRAQVQRLPIGIWPVRDSDEFDVLSGRVTKVRASWATPDEPSHDLGR